METVVDAPLPRGGGYVWSYMDKGEPQYVAVLEIPPVDSAETAVKIAILAGGK